MNELLEKYWNGETTLQEEKQLKAYFLTEQVAPEHENYKAIFSAFVSEKKESATGFNAFASLPDEEFNTTESRNESPRFNKQLVKGLAVAAGFAAIFTVGLMYDDYRETNLQKEELGTYKSPEEAHQATMGALQLMSTKFNNGRENLEPLKELDNQKEKISEADSLLKVKNKN